ncbi:MAG: hypothetical protein MI724_09330 [Spirochaetales bacterium]|nr:hypothetical protein [Spirochaetales bacterium]
MNVWRPFRRRSGVYFVHAAILIVASTGVIGAQDYELFGSVELRSETAHRKDSDAVADSDSRDTWYTGGELHLAATHRFSFEMGAMVLDHEIIVGPVTSGGAGTGSGGVGAGEATEVELTHELYQGYLSLFVSPSFSATLGRRRLNWGKAFAFSVTDALHPQSPDSEVEPGFDGAVGALLLGPNLSIELAGAVQEAASNDGAVEDVRGAAYVSAFAAPFDVAVGYVFQHETINRPGALVSVPVGPLLFVGEAGLEIYDARDDEIELQPLASVGVEYSIFGMLREVTVRGEYLYNGLAANRPAGTATSSSVVTNDFAGGFERPGEHYLYGQISYQLVDSWYTSHAVLYNASDESAYIEHGIGLVAIPGIDLDLAGIWNSGGTESEFGAIPDDFTIRIAVKGSF